MHAPGDIQGARALRAAAWQPAAIKKLETSEPIIMYEPYLDPDSNKQNGKIMSQLGKFEDWTDDSKESLVNLS